MNRTDVINKVVEHIDAKTYLEIGIRDRRDNFDLIRVPMKLGVDPRLGSHSDIVGMKSAEYYETDEARRKWDLIFIDGDHSFLSAQIDMEYAMSHMNPGGMFVMHDVAPRDPAAMKAIKRGGGPWNGEVWRVWLAVRTLLMARSFAVLCDHGVGVVLPHAENECRLVAGDGRDGGDIGVAEFLDRRTKMCRGVRPAQLEDMLCRMSR